MKRIQLDKIASATARLELGRRVYIDPGHIVAEEGSVVAVRALEDKDVYNELEDPHGRMLRIWRGDVIAGVLGRRRALLGHAGSVPEQIAAGDVLHMLNLGGVIGACSSSNPAVGAPLRVEVLGQVQSFPVLESRRGEPAHLGSSALEPVDALDALPPLVFLSGTCMNAGKTLAACAVVRELTRRGLEVAAAKLTGVSLRRDTLAMRDCGATRALSFTDAGYPSTGAETAPRAARAVLGALADGGLASPDVIVVELGDGLLGEYGVLPILRQSDIARQPAVHVCCAADPVGAHGAAALFESELDATIDVFSGPVTDNEVGCRALQERLGTPAVNARREPVALGEEVAAALQRLSQ